MKYSVRDIALMLMKYFLIWCIIRHKYTLKERKIWEYERKRQ